MGDAAERTGVGPMAAVAGAIAELAIRQTTTVNAEHIVDNGGDIFLCLCEEALVGLYAGDRRGLPPLALRVAPELTPLAICSSSSTMGHSTSLGNCELATVLSKSGALADAAATAACNSVRTRADIQPTLERIGAVPGVIGVILINDGHLGMIGDLPPVVRTGGSSYVRKVAGSPPGLRPDV